MVVRTGRHAPDRSKSSGYSVSSAKQENGGLYGLTLDGLTAPRTLSFARVSRSMAATEVGVVISLGVVLLRSGPEVGLWVKSPR
jgi:hypothetical protein